MLSGFELLIALITVFVGATVMGTVSFGLGLVVAPILLLFLAPQPVVVIVNSVIAILLALVLFQTRQHLDLRRVGGMTLGGLAAVPIGVFFLRSAVVCPSSTACAPILVPAPSVTCLPMVA